MMCNSLGLTDNQKAFLILTVFPCSFDFEFESDQYFF